MNGEEPGLLGNLPRSRPGTRSEKRAGAAPAEPAPRPREPASGDPVGGVLRTAGRAAEAGLRTAGDVTREILRRLPRP